MSFRQHKGTQIDRSHIMSPRRIILPGLAASLFKVLNDFR